MNVRSAGAGTGSVNVVNVRKAPRGRSVHVRVKSVGAARSVHVDHVRRIVGARSIRVNHVRRTAGAQSIRVGHVRRTVSARSVHVIHVRSIVGNDAINPPPTSPT